MRKLFAAPLRFIIFIIQSIQLALGQIWANKMRSMLTTIGIIIGVASVTAVVAAMTGLKTKVLKEFESFGANSIYLTPRVPEEGRLKNAAMRLIQFKPSEFNGVLEHCESIEYFSRMGFTGQNVRKGQRSIQNVEITGIEPSWHKIEDRSVVMGRPFTIVDKNQTGRVCLITPDVRDKLYLDYDCIGQTIVVGGRTFTIVGVVDKRIESSMFGGSGESFEIYVPYQTAYKLWQPYTMLLAASKTPELANDARAELRFYMRRIKNLKPGDPDTFRIDVIQQVVNRFNQLSMVMTAVAAGIVGISLLVGGVGIMNIMLVSVSERTREIGLRKAVGARPAAILLQFLVEAVMLCLMGGLLGILFGQVFTMGISKIPNANLDLSYIPAWAVSVSFGFSALVGVTFGMFPAIKASQLDPIEALRHE